jgi:hypothetical protein
MFEESKLDWLKLPPRNYGELNERLQYGADRVAADYCGLKNIPNYFDGHWQHGWMAPYFNQGVSHVIPEKVFDKNIEPCFVARKDQEEFLKNSGYISHAIGLPIAYTTPSQCVRKKGSLLVMPAHSNEYTQHRWKFEQYADEINSIKSHFSEVVVCVHKGCVANNYWISNFCRRGFPIIVGADAADRNSLTRMRHLMEQFEFVTTNAYGSCLAYGAAFGAKVSIYGSFSEPKLEDFSEIIHLYEKKIWDEAIYLQSENKTREELNDFFTHPALSKDQTAWGSRQIGCENIISPEELKKHFKWNRRDMLLQKTYKKFWLFEIELTKRTPRFIKNILIHLRKT